MVNNVNTLVMYYIIYSHDMNCIPSISYVFFGCYLLLNAKVILLIIFLARAPRCALGARLTLWSACSMCVRTRHTEVFWSWILRLGQIISARYGGSKNYALITLQWFAGYDIPGRVHLACSVRVHVNTYRTLFKRIWAHDGRAANACLTYRVMQTIPAGSLPLQ